MKVYIAGALFNEAEVNQRKLEGKLLREAFPTWDIFNPIEAPFNDKQATLPTPQEIYLGDTTKVKECNVFIADLTNEDAGTLVELGIAIESNTDIIIAINSDIRLSNANQYEIPTYGMNHYVLGAVLTQGILVHTLKEAIEYLKTKV